MELMAKKELIYDCCVCGNSFDNLIKFLKHKTSKGHVSNLRKKLFFLKVRKKYLKFHRTDERKKFSIQGNVLSCFICGRKFFKKRIYEAHLAIHGSKVCRNKIFNCKFCKKNLFSLAAFRIHCIKTHKIHNSTYGFMSYEENVAFEKSLHRYTQEKPSRVKSISKCSKCDMAFKTRGMLKKHKCHREVPKCHECGKIFSNERSKKIHLLTHSTIKPHQCFDCNKSFSFEHALLIHRRVHTGEKPYTCKICNRAYTMKTSLNKHMKSHRKDCVNTCPECGKNLATPFLLKLHVRTHTGEKPFPCSVCHKSFACKAYLEIHSRTHSDHRPYSCQKCSKRFKQISHLKVHMLTHSKSTSHTCSKCNQEFTLRLSLNRHMKRYHSVNDHVFKCPSCIAEFSLRDELHSHMKHSHLMSEDEISFALDSTVDSFEEVTEQGNHQKAQPSHACTECGKLFMQKSSLKKHASIHQRQYRCDLCEKSFEFESCLMKHMTIHSKRVHGCDQCSSSFTSKSTLKAHMLTHTGEKPFECNTCSKKFNTKSNLTVHLRTHTKDRPFKCPHCLQTFTQSSSLNYHMRRHPQKELNAKPVEIPFNCSDCKMAFNNLKDLETHMLSHNVSSTKSCQICNQLFLREEDLLSHMTSHAVEKPVCVIKTEELSEVMQEIIIDTSFKSEVLVLKLKEETFMDSELEKISDNVDPNAILDCENDDEMPDLEDVTINSDDENVPIKQEIGNLSTKETIVLEESDVKEEACDSHFCEISLYQSDPLRTCIAMHRVTSHKCNLCEEVFAKKSCLNDHILSHTNIHEYETGNLMNIDINDINDSTFTEVDHFTVISEDFSENSEVVNSIKKCDSTKVKIEIAGHSDLSKKNCSIKTSMNNCLLIPNNEKRFECEVCHEIFAISSDLKEHMIIHSREKQFSSEMGGKTLIQKTVHNHHPQRHPDAKPFNRKFCGKAFNQESGLTKHVRIHMKRAYDCSVCGKTFSQNRSLELHRKVHEMCTSTTDDQALIIVNADPFQCTICSEKFSENQELEAHLVQHSVKASQKETCIKSESCLEEDMPPQVISSKNKMPSKNMTPHECPECSKSFKVLASLKSHMRIHTGEKPFECSVCGRKFSSNKNLKTHTLVHTGVKPYQCDICGKRFKQVVHRRNHLRVHSEVKPYTCILCGKGYTVSNSLKLHMKSHTGDKPFECSVCGKKFSQKGLLKSHMISHTGYKPLGCLKCNKKYAQASHLIKHMMVAHLDLKAYQCTLCEEDFTRKNGLIGHLQEHKKEESPECLICEKVFLPDEVENHVLAHVRDGYRTWQHHSQKAKMDGEASYKCCVCDQTFLWRIELKTHLSTHIGVKPYECSLCGISFIGESSLRSHELSHKVKEEQKKPVLQCTLCPKQFKFKGCYDSHIAKHSEIKSFECPTCSKIFKTKGILKGHMLIHSGERPHKCSTCGKDFLTTSALNVHLKRHSAEKYPAKKENTSQIHTKLQTEKTEKLNGEVKQVEMKKTASFSCRHCHEVFNLKNELVTHMLSHDDEKAYLCTYCPRGFSRKAALKKHMVVHKEHEESTIANVSSDKVAKMNRKSKGKQR